MQCHRCGFIIQAKHRIGRQQKCPQCDQYIHCCFNCLFYDANAYHQCREPQSDWVTEKDAPNFCDYFKPSEIIRKINSTKADEAKKKLNDLFKKDEDP